MAAETAMPLWQLKKLMCDIGHRIWLKGFCAGNEGNHSVRIGEDRVLCTPTGVSKGFMTPEDICVVDMNGKQVEPNARGRQRTSEVLIHLAIYKHRPDVRAVVHSHPPHATAFAIANIPLPEGIHPEAEVFLGRVPIARYATPSKPDLADSLLPLIGPETNTVLMGNHGTVTFDQDLMGAYYKLEILDAYSRILLLCKQLGRAKTLSAQQMTELLEVKQNFGIPDARLACAPQGCVGQQNQAFFATFDVHPASAACASDGGPVIARQSTMRPDRGNGGMPDEASFEAMVQAITDQIMSLAGRH